MDYSPYDLANVSKIRKFKGLPFVNLIDFRNLPIRAIWKIDRHNGIDRCAFYRQVGREGCEYVSDDLMYEYIGKISQELTAESKKLVAFILVYNYGVSFVLKHN